MPTASKALDTLDLTSLQVKLNFPRPNATSASTVGITTCNKRGMPSEALSGSSFEHFSSHNNKQTVLVSPNHPCFEL